MKKIAVTSNGNNLESSFSHQVGRAPWLIFYNSDSKEFQAIDNSNNQNAPQGAGIQTGQTIVNENADVLITGHCGPKAKSVMKNIELYETTALTVKEALLNYELKK